MPQSTHYLVIGGGPAAALACVGIRSRDTENPITLVTSEPYPPYDKPPLSKKYLVRDDFVPDDITSKADDYYATNAINLITGKKAIAVDRETKTVKFDDGDAIGYEKLLLATGASPSHLRFPGAGLPGIYNIRTIPDAEGIRDLFHKSKTAVVVGAGYIGMEAAQALQGAGVQVSVIEQGDHPWGKFVGPEIGGYLRGEFEKRGVRFLFGDEPIEFRGDAKVESVLTRDGQESAADLVVVAIGVHLNSGLARESGLEMNDADAIMVDDKFQTSDPNIWAAGDIACYPDRVLDKSWHVEHHLNAKWTGERAGANMAGLNEPFERVTYFWSDLFDMHMILRGDPECWAHERVIGEIAAGEFVQLRGDSEEVLRFGIAMSHDEPKLDPISDKLEELIKAKAPIASVRPADFGF